MYGNAARMPAGQRLVAGRAGERIEPDEPVAVAPQAGRLGGDQRRVAAVPAVRDDDHDARRPQRPPRPVQVELRNDSPIRVPPAQSVTDSATRASARSRSRSRSRRVTRVSRVPKTNDSVRTSEAADERLDEPEQQAGVALHRARDVADHDERARPRIGRRQTHVRSWPPGPEVAPEHRPRREAAAVRVELVAARAPPLEPRDQRVDEPLRLAQLGRRHPVELAVAQDLPLAVRIRARSRRPRSAPSSSSLVAVGRDRHARVRRPLASRSSAVPAAARRRRLSALVASVASVRAAVSGGGSELGQTDAAARQHRSKTAS